MEEPIEGLDEWAANGSDYSVPVSGLQATDSHTLVIRLVKAYPQFVHTLAQGYASVVSREAVETYGREMSTRPVGSGPYSLLSFDSTRAVLVRNPDYRKEPIVLADEGYSESLHGNLGLQSIAGKIPPLSDRIEVNFIAEDTARITSLTKGGELHTARLPAPVFDQFLDSTEPPRLKPDYAEILIWLRALRPGLSILILILTTRFRYCGRSCTE